MKTLKIWTESEFMKQSPCPEGMVFCRDRQFDWPRIWRECQRGDWLIWALKRCGVTLDKMTWVKIAVASAEHVLEICEKRFPEDKRPRQAIAAAQAWIDRPCEETRLAAEAAANASRESALDASEAADSTYALAAAALSAEAAAANAANAARAAYAANAAAVASGYASSATYAYAAITSDPSYLDADGKKEHAWQAEMIRRICEIDEQKLNSPYSTSKNL